MTSRDFHLLSAGVPFISLLQTNYYFPANQDDGVFLPPIFYDTNVFGIQNFYLPNLKVFNFFAR